MINLIAAIAKAIGKADELRPRVQGTHISKHRSGKQRPQDFTKKRKVRRYMAKRSRRINRKML
jgi:hypothetical protein